MSTMSKQENIQFMDALAKRVQRREERRNFFKKSAGFMAGAAATGVMLSGCGDGNNNTNSTGTSTAAAATVVNGSTQQDLNVLNFALNLEYLEASFYIYATTGAGLPASFMTGTGTQGTVTGGQAVNFMGDTTTQQYANEIANDEYRHVFFLRSQLGSNAVAMPNINISGTDPNAAFSKAAQAAGIIPAGTAFNPYLNPLNFLLAAYIFEDVGVTAYNGASTLISSAAYLQAAASILGVEAYHAGLIRTVLYGMGVTNATVFSQADAIANARDSLDGSTHDDEGISPTAGLATNGGSTTTGPAARANIVPADANGLAFARTTGQVLNIVYLTKTAANSGGFFPNGVNGNIVTSTAEP